MSSTPKCDNDHIRDFILVALYPELLDHARYAAYVFDDE